MSARVLVVGLDAAEANRRLARDFERYARTVFAFVRLAMIRIMLRRLTPPNPCQ